MHTSAPPDQCSPDRCRSTSPALVLTILLAVAIGGCLGTSGPSSTQTAEGTETIDWIERARTWNFSGLNGSFDRSLTGGSPAGTAWIHIAAPVQTNGSRTTFHNEVEVTWATSDPGNLTYEDRETDRRWWADHTWLADGGFDTNRQEGPMWESWYANGRARATWGVRAETGDRTVRSPEVRYAPRLVYESAVGYSGTGSLRTETWWHDDEGFGEVLDRSGIERPVYHRVLAVDMAQIEHVNVSATWSNTTMAVSTGLDEPTVAYHDEDFRCRACVDAYNGFGLRSVRGERQLTADLQFDRPFILASVPDDGIGPGPAEQSTGSTVIRPDGVTERPGAWLRVTDRAGTWTFRVNASESVTDDDGGVPVAAAPFTPARLPWESTAS